MTTPKLIKYTIYLFSFIILIFGCNISFKSQPYPYYQIEGDILEIITYDTIENCPCILFKSTKTISNKEEVGIKIKFLKKYFRLDENKNRIFGDEYQPGKLGSIEKIKWLKIFLKNSETDHSIDITENFFCNQHLLDNSKERWKNYPQENQNITCYYLDADQNPRIYHTYILNNTEQSDTKTDTDTGEYFSRKISNTSYLNGWDLKVDSSSFLKQIPFRNLEDFRLKFNDNLIPYKGNDYISLEFFLSKKLPFKDYNQFIFRLKFDDGREIELISNYISADVK